MGCIFLAKDSLFLSSSKIGVMAPLGNETQHLVA